MRCIICRNFALIPLSPVCTYLDYITAWIRYTNAFAPLCASVCLSAIPQSHFLINFHIKWHRGKKNPKNDTIWLGSTLDHHTIIPQKTAQNRCKREYSNQSSKVVELEHLGHIGPDHDTTDREDTAHQGEVVGGPKWGNNRSKVADGLILEIHLQVYFCNFMTDLHQNGYNRVTTT